MNEPFDMKTMIADYMESGFLENIIDMFKHDKSLFSLLGHLIADERGRVRLGTVALVEDLREEYTDEVVEAVPYIAKNLKDPNPTIRADAAYLLGTIGHRDALSYLSEAVNDEDVLVREMIKDTIAYLSVLSERDGLR